MPNIVLTRIDNRLIHGQVATQWCTSIGANLILVANDDVANNSLRQGLMDMAAPAGVATRYWSIQKTIDNIHRASDAQKIFIVCESPIDVLKLVQGGVPIKKVNIGNMHMAEGKRQVATVVAVNDEDVAAFEQLRDLGVELEIRKVPTEGTEDVSKLFK
ncbi:MAG: PTS N-acetylgalactosamine transporter subunit IIB [Erysipelotrichaceae bacterium]|nr:PTS N-acetylgalactosamine transporter subunit IIB [Erysipelotrichaceae bacterium]